MKNAMQLKAVMKKIAKEKNISAQLVLQLVLQNKKQSKNGGNLIQ
ncbi:MAG: hypothetical protein Q4C63_08735 [Eubacteriales bacterium]|nr:hypothetical protein [Eubacteriales bacterium]